MSIKKMTEVWEHSRADGTALVLLLKIADHANDAGWAWPGIDRLAAACRRSRRQTQSLLAKLISLGELEVQVGRGANHVNRYRISVTPRPALVFHEEPTDAENCTGEESRTDAVSGDHGRSGQHGEENCTGEAQRAHGCSGLHPNHKESSSQEKRARDQSHGMEQSEKREKLNALLARHCFSTSDKSRRDWQNMVSEYGGARTFEQKYDCIQWCIKTARADGKRVKHAEDVIAYAKRWAEVSARASA